MWKAFALCTALASSPWVNGAPNNPLLPQDTELESSSLRECGLIAEVISIEINDAIMKSLFGD